MDAFLKALPVLLELIPGLLQIIRNAIAGKPPTASDVYCKVLPGLEETCQKLSSGDATVLSSIVVLLDHDIQRLRKNSKSS